MMLLTREKRINLNRIIQNIANHRNNYKIDVPKDITKELLAIAEKQFKELKKKGQLIKVTKYKK